MKRIIRGRRLSSEEAAKQNDIRKQVARELPKLIKRHDERITAREESQESREQSKEPRMQ